ncbi:Retrovirus-related Pol polyprotein from transposon RE1 [Vitis vinifera]|uniref:Retrovirus-related Pol polyprotein from transposon RE1 n=1 Tax=Vitis vinifera TaxID=29760 RepID=A0A438CQD7_VITVI|nr:Retrovirus-related Pol polyprotein from transposon RE1 [Vitis vinifera]
MASSTQTMPEIVSSQVTPTLNMSMLNHPLPIKLDRDNHILWHTQMENVIYANGFEDHIEGLRPCPPKTISTGEVNPDFLVWRRYDRMILSWIYSSLTPEVMGQIVGLQTSHEAWTALQRSFSASTKARTMQLRLAFQTTKKGSLTMMEYIQKLKHISDSLAAIGEPVLEKDQILQLLSGLGAEYNPIVASLTARDDDIQLHAVHSILLTHEQRLHLQTTTTEEDLLIANFATHNRPRRSQSNKPSQGKPPQSFMPTIRPDTLPDSRQQYPQGYRPNRFNNNRSRTNNRPQCQLCGKFGHMVLSCYHRFDVNYQGPRAPASSTSQIGLTPPAQAMMAAPSSASMDSWFLDSGATHHLSHTAANIHNGTPYNGTDSMMVGNGKSLPITQVGHSFLHTPAKPFVLHNVLHVPQLTSNLISVSKFCTDNNTILEFHPSSFFVKDKDTKVTLLQGQLERGLYKFPTSSISSPTASPKHQVFLTKTQPTTMLWHQRFGHPSGVILQKIFHTCNISHNSNKTVDVCNACCCAKSHKLPFSLSTSRASSPLELIHADLWGPAPVPSSTGARYFLLLMDDYSRFVWFYLLPTKDQVHSTFVQFKTLVENQFQTTIKCLQTDHGGEFIALTKFLSLHGILHRFSCPYTPEQMAE